MPCRPCQSLLTSCRPRQSLLTSCRPRQSLLTSYQPHNLVGGGGYSTQAPADAKLGRGLIASVMDPPLLPVRATGIPRASALAVTETVPLNSVIPVMAVAILCVWAAHYNPEASPVHESAPEASPVPESPPEASRGGGFRCRTTRDSGFRCRTSQCGGAHLWTPSLPCNSHGGCS